jgi:SAM-dependent methyltransferase
MGEPMDLDLIPCPSCGQLKLEPFHRQSAVPSNSCLLLPTREAAEEFTRGDIDLGFCGSCGFITNVAFDASLAEYSSRYEETQAFSQRFVEFAEALAGRWVETYDLQGRAVLEVGCGKGEFLVMMAEAGIGAGTGIDPGVHPERIQSEAADKLTWIADLYSEEYSDIEADAVVCRHTLEHITDVGAFVEMTRRIIGSRLDTVVLFELPDTLRVLNEVAFWDIYYEHCSYFSAGSLARLFERSGFEVVDLHMDYDDQYLILEARPVADGTDPEPWAVDDMGVLRASIGTFSDGYDETIRFWRAKLSSVTDSGGTVVIWGAGSKGVSFLAELGDHVHSAVDINPHKHGMYMAGTGHRIEAPDTLPSLQPDLVIVMNPIYVDEIRTHLDALGIDPEVVAL